MAVSRSRNDDGAWTPRMKRIVKMLLGEEAPISKPILRYAGCVEEVKRQYVAVEHHGVEPYYTPSFEHSSRIERRSTTKLADCI